MSSESLDEGVKEKLSIAGCLRAFVTLIFFSALLISGTETAVAQIESVLYSFTGGTDGANPFAGLIGDGKGNLYGTTQFGGVSGCLGGFGCGTVFEIAPTGTFEVLYSFAGGVDGGNPLGGLVRDGRGNFYGTTSYLGPFNHGTVFEIAQDHAEKVLYGFTGRADGADPYAGLVRDGQGNLYGTTFYGGTSGAGTVFKVTPTGTETALYSFTMTPDGEQPYAGLVRNWKGNLYGTTPYGGTHGWGSVFKLSPTGTETVLYSFTGGADGAFPIGGLIRDQNGSLYGTTFNGGTSDSGTIFKITSTGTETVLYSFGGADGAHPQGVLVRDAQGNFYGTTAYGGAFGFGTVFELTVTGTETVLYSFIGGADGANPRPGLLRDTQGNLYGTTQNGGVFNYGTVFKLIP